jgi:hypothetical protein
METWRREISPGSRQVDLKLTSVFTPVEVSDGICLTHVDEIRTADNRYEV